MATFSGRNSPTALAALAPSINNLAAAKRAKSQAAAGLMNTLGVQFEKQKQQTAKREQNEAAQQVAEKLLQDPAFRRQAPGITDSASLVKLVGAENVIGYGMQTQQADRVAQESAANIGLIKKQIEQYDIDAKQREAEEASGKALTTLVGGMYGEGFTQKDLITGLQGLSSGDAVRALNIYNERNPGEMLEQRTIGGRTFVYNTKTGATFDLGTGSELPEAYTKGLALIKEQFAEGTPEYERAVQNLTDRTLGYDVTLGESAFGGQPAAGGAAGGAVEFPSDVMEAYSLTTRPILDKQGFVDSRQLEGYISDLRQDPGTTHPEEFYTQLRAFAQSESEAARKNMATEAKDDIRTGSEFIEDVEAGQAASSGGGGFFSQKGTPVFAGSSGLGPSIVPVAISEKSIPGLSTGTLNASLDLSNRLNSLPSGKREELFREAKRLAVGRHGLKPSGAYQGRDKKKIMSIITSTVLSDLGLGSNIGDKSKVDTSEELKARTYLNGVINTLLTRFENRGL